ncbi:MAG: peptidoglycan DD-metalloendopeptidase family protein [Chitinophagaceae bacterium]|nr:peptidoglycan DD-metalloendopeptidase family protein [Chitinophagaceae bacterium]MBL0130629.1 peptidoglycan DD-metalloendopeptidase family protein [Chitinophagaceae bacterium]MBL0274276.1 peptidoglycan DD-metalloendopeptidase family protein [Chitinophagaceae bacterium]
MKNLMKLCLLVIFFQPGDLLAQKESIRLICPLNDATIVPPPKNVIHFEEPDLCVVLQSVPDTIVKSVGIGRVTNTELTDDSKNGLVLFVKINGKDYYFWYTGLNKLLVKRNDVVKLGQPLGYISPGESIELLMYEFDKPVDPTNYLDCKNVLKSDK